MVTVLIHCQLHVVSHKDLFWGYLVILCYIVCYRKINTMMMMILPGGLFLYYNILWQSVIAGLCTVSHYVGSGSYSHISVSRRKIVSQLDDMMQYNTVSVAEEVQVAQEEGVAAEDEDAVQEGAELPEEERVAEELFKCHEECGWHRTYSMCTLSGDEVTDFGSLHGLNVSCDSVSTGSAGTECFHDSDEGYTL